jgi:Uncharacterised nucleotidyltransferase
VTRWRAFLALCQYLRKGLLDGNPSAVVRDPAWELVIEASSYHFVTPVLAWCLRGVSLPPEVGEYLKTVLALNGKRNESLLAGLSRVVTALNGIDIEPVLLKGSARLVEATYPSSDLRFLGDLDVLIPAERTTAAVSALGALGFYTDPSYPSLSASAHHLTILHDPETGAGVELHTAILPGWAGSLLPIDWFYRGTRSFQFRNLELRLPDAMRSIGHIVAHDQLHHNNYRKRRFELRQLTDLAAIRNKSEPAIDWPELDDRLCRAGVGRVLSTYLKFGQKLLGQPMPPVKHMALPAACAQFRWTMEPTRLRACGRVGLTAVRCVGNPRYALSLFQADKWRRHIFSEFKLKQPMW